MAGSSCLSNDLIDFVKILGEKIIERTKLVLVTGGLKKHVEGKTTVDGSFECTTVSNSSPRHVPTNRNRKRQYKSNTHT